jgi:hypothetical protein
VDTNAGDDSSGERAGNRRGGEKKPVRDRKRDRRGGAGAVVVGGSGGYVPPAASYDSGGQAAGTSQGTNTGTSGSGQRNEEPREQPAPPPPPPAPPNIYLYHLFNTETREHYMTISGAQVEGRPTSEGWRHTVVGRVYSTPVKGTRGITLHDGNTAYVFTNSHPETEPSTNAAPIYRGSDGGGFFYSRSATDAESYTAVGYVAI